MSEALDAAWKAGKARAGHHRRAALSRHRILYRYVLSETATPTALAFLAYTFILLMNQFFLLADYAYRYSLPIGRLSELFVLQLPHVIVLTLPIALLVGFLVASARMATDSELVALAASGVSFTALLRPVLHLALLFAVITGALTYDTMPRANRKAGETVLEMLRDNLVNNVKPRQFNARLLPRYVLYIDRIERGADGRQLWRGVVLDSPVAPGREQREVYFAREARPVIDQEAGALLIQFRDLTVHSWSGTGDGAYDVRFVSRYAKSIEPPPLLHRGRSDRSQRSVREQTVPELLERLYAGHWRGQQEHRLTHLELHKRFSIPAACLVFAFLGLGLGATARKTGRAIAFVASLAVMLGYYQTFYVGERLAVEGRLPSGLSMWMGNIAFGILGLYLFARRATEGRFRLGFERLLDPLRKAWSATSAAYLRRRDAWIDLRSRGHHGGRFLRLLDRYIAGVFLRILAMVSLSSLLLYVQVSLFQLLDDILRNAVPLSTVAKLYLAWLPEMLTYIIPVSVLIATVIAFSMLTRSSEMTAMLTGGVSLYRAVLPVVGASALLSVASWWLHASVLPRTAERKEVLMSEVRGEPSHRPVPARWSADRTATVFLHFRSFDSQTETFHGLSVITVGDSTRPIEHLYAHRARFVDSMLEAEDGWRRTFRPDGVVFQPFATQTLVAETSREEMTRRWRKPGFMTARELDRVIRSKQAVGLDTQELQLELATRRSQPFLPLVMALVGLPFAFAIGRRGSLYGIGIAIAIAIVYWSAVVVAGHLGKLGILPIGLAAWSPSIVFALLGLMGFLNLRT